MQTAFEKLDVSINLEAIHNNELLLVSHGASCKQTENFIPHNYAIQWVGIALITQTQYHERTQKHGNTKKPAPPVTTTQPRSEIPLVLQQSVSISKLHDLVYL